MELQIPKMDRGSASSRASCSRASAASRRWSLSSSRSMSAVSRPGGSISSSRASGLRISKKRGQPHRRATRRAGPSVPRAAVRRAAPLPVRRRQGREGPRRRARRQQVRGRRAWCPGDRTPRDHRPRRSARLRPRRSGATFGGQLGRARPDAGVHLAMSNAHPGLKAALAQVLGTAWQRCTCTTCARAVWGTPARTSTGSARRLDPADLPRRRRSRRHARATARQSPSSKGGCPSSPRCWKAPRTTSSPSTPSRPSIGRSCAPGCSAASRRLCRSGRDERRRADQGGALQQGAGQGCPAVWRARASFSQEEEPALYAHYGLDYGEAARTADSRGARGRARASAVTSAARRPDAMTRSEEELRSARPGARPAVRGCASTWSPRT